MIHISHAELNKQITEAGKHVTVGDIYKHYKYQDRDYQVIGFGIQEATRKVCVIYSDTSSPDIRFVRDLDSWLEQVGDVPRFVLA